MTMIVLSEASERLAPSASARDITASPEAAKLVGCQVYYIPQNFTDCGDAEGALWHIPKQTKTVPGVWQGYIPDLAKYRQVYEAAREKNIILLNTPDQHQRAQEFDRAYPHLEGITPNSRILTAVSQCQAAAEALGLPVFAVLIEWEDMTSKVHRTHFEVHRWNALLVHNTLLELCRRELHSAVIFQRPFQILRDNKETIFNLKLL